MAGPALPAPGTGWQITGQVPTVGTANGNVTQGWNINFTSGRGHQGVLFVPAASYNTDYVRAQITDLATRLDNVGALTG